MVAIKQEKEKGKRKKLMTKRGNCIGRGEIERNKADGNQKCSTVVVWGKQDRKKEVKE